MTVELSPAVGPVDFSSQKSFHMSRDENPLLMLLYAPNEVGALI